MLISCTFISVELMDIEVTVSSIVIANEISLKFLFKIGIIFGITLESESSHVSCL